MGWDEMKVMSWGYNRKKILSGHVYAAVRYKREKIKGRDAVGRSEQQRFC